MWPLLLFSAIQVADAAMTWAGVQRFGLAAEGNPILAACMATVGVGLTLVGAKLLAFGFATALHWRSLDFVIALLTLLYVAAAICPWALASAL